MRLTDAQVEAATARPRFPDTMRASAEGALAAYDADRLVQIAPREVGH